MISFTIRINFKNELTYEHDLVVVTLLKDLKLLVNEQVDVVLARTLIVVVALVSVASGD